MLAGFSKHFDTGKAEELILDLCIATVKYNLSI